jgi:hypothetical protein
MSWALPVTILIMGMFIMPESVVMIVKAFRGRGE